MTTRWKPILIRFVDRELNTLKEYCAKNNIKITELVRNAVRLYIANPDILNGVVRANGVFEIKQLLDSMDKVTQKLEVLERKLNSYPMNEKFSDSLIKARIKECILEIREKYRKEPITVDKLKLKIKKMDPSLAPYLVASATNGFSLLDEVLMELHGRELSRDFNGIIRFNGD
jgi:hypothetical protein